MPIRGGFSVEGNTGDIDYNYHVVEIYDSSRNHTYRSGINEDRLSNLEPDDYFRIEITKDDGMVDWITFWGPYEIEELEADLQAAVEEGDYG